MLQGFGRSSPTELDRRVPITRLKDNEDIRDIYEIGRQLGHGTFGAVYETTQIKTQSKWAIKMVCRPTPGSPKVEMLDNEIDILRQVNHPHIIRLEAIYSTAKMMYLVTELCEGGDLKHLLQQKMYFTEDETRKIIHCLADAVTYLHMRNIVHRDLKLENILLKNPINEDNGEMDVKVADFGLSIKKKSMGIERMMSETCGTLIYMAPEVLKGNDYSQLCDAWSIGVIMFMLLCGEPPFVSKTRENLLKKIESRDLIFSQPIWDSISDAAKYILTNLLKAEPVFRMSPSDLLGSSWFRGDTTVPSGPNNIVEMMGACLEEEEAGKQTAEVSPLTSPEVTLEPSLASLALSDETHGNHGSHAKTCAQRDVSPCIPTTSTAQPKRNVGRPAQDQNINDTVRMGNQTKFHLRKASSTQLGAKPRKHPVKKVFRSAQKLTPDSEASPGRVPFSSKTQLTCENPKIVCTKSPIQSKIQK
ncbi:serine/threonine-protein kinase 33 isoform X1 [Oryzias melastigma]|uniref:Serine/threonine kinase 33 n=1 Tax=Oryzias melastigma TaxID=30732 RepID=A0A3B3CQG2_ORYME|nr:serine/threonine-protein kinase 33 isoform X1 [Oryzias melastigma]